jgi:hypothetical protein
MSGAHRAASGVAQDGLVDSVNASPTWVQLTRSAERAVGMMCLVPSLSRSGSVVP